jgi:hypothetical protein
MQMTVFSLQPKFHLGIVSEAIRSCFGCFQFDDIVSRLKPSEVKWQWRTVSVASNLCILSDLNEEIEDKVHTVTLDPGVQHFGRDGEFESPLEK